MTGRKKPVFGIISLVMMLGLVVAAVLVTMYGPSAVVEQKDESLAVALGAVANIIVTLLVLGVTSLLSLISGLIGLLRREPPMPAAAGSALATAVLTAVILTAVQL